MSNPSLPVPTLHQVSSSGNQNGEKKEGYFNYELEPGCTVQVRWDLDLTMDPKKLKRIIANRLSAQRSKWRKQQYVEYLEKQVKELQWQMSEQRSKVDMLSKVNHNLEIKNRMLEERSFALRHRAISAKEAIEALAAEMERQ